MNAHFPSILKTLIQKEKRESSKGKGGILLTFVFESTVFQ